MDVVTLGAALSIMKKMPDTAASSAAAAEDAADRAEEAARTLTIDDTLSKPGQPADSKAVGDTLAEKLDIADLPDTVNNANQLLSEKYVIDTEPYQLRPSGGQGADREFDTIVGGSIVWNQLAKIDAIKSGVSNGISYEANGDGFISLTGTADDSIFSVIFGTIVNAIAKDHLYYPAFGNLVFNNNSIMLMVNSWGAVFNVGVLKKATTNVPAGSTVGIRIPTGRSVDGTYAVQLFDLTQMFGSEIADYIYNLEQTTPGAGVAWFRKYFPNDYYEYNAGELMHVSGLQSHDIVGFNLWDEEWEVGAYNGSTGAKSSATGRIRSKNHISVLPNTTYYFKKDGWEIITIYYYGENKEYLGQNTLSGENSSLTTGANTHYITFNTGANTGSVYKNDICINLSGTRNKEYEPYVKHSYPLDSSLTLRGVPKLVDGKLSFDGDIYKPDGTVKRRYGTRAYESGDESLSNAITDGTNTVYKLTTPTTEEAEPYQSPQILNPYGTEEYVTTSLVPVGHETKYPENLRAKIEGLPWNFASLIAPVEAEFTATRNYTSGSLFIVDNTLYKATANIANGGTITPNTNCTATTLAEIIAAL